MARYQSITEWRFGDRRIQPGEYLELDPKRGAQLASRRLVIAVPEPEPEQKRAASKAPPPKVETAIQEQPAEEQAAVQTPKRTRKTRKTAAQES